MMAPFRRAGCASQGRAPGANHHGISLSRLGRGTGREAARVRGHQSPITRRVGRRRVLKEMWFTQRRRYKERSPRNRARLRVSADHSRARNRDRLRRLAKPLCVSASLCDLCVKQPPPRPNACSKNAPTDRNTRKFRAFHLCPLSSLSTVGIALARIGFHDTSRTWPRRSTGNGRKPSQPQPERGRLLSHQAIEAVERRPGRLTKPPPCGSCGLAL